MTMMLQKAKGSLEFEEQPTFLRVKSQCDACGVDFAAGDLFVGLVGDDASGNIPFQPYGNFTFPEGPHIWNNSKIVDGWQLCRSTFCSRCVKLPDSAAIHTECYELLLQHCSFKDKIDRLGIATAWRDPWSGRKPLELYPSADIVRGIRVVANVCGLPSLVSLPLEIAAMIHRYSETHMIWRFASVLELLDRPDAAQDDDMSQIPVHRIRAWQRGGLPTIGSCDEKPIVRLVIDSHGLKQIERLSKMPAASSQRSESLAWIVETDASLKGLTVNFKYGHARLSAPDRMQKIFIWDRACPPSLNDCILRGSPSSSTSKLAKFFLGAPLHRMKSVDTRKCTGLTFFFIRGGLYAIHTHTTESPNAWSTCERFPADYYAIAQWVYLPLPPLDRLIAFGLRVPEEEEAYDGCFGIVVRTALCGDITLGPSFDVKTSCHMRSSGRGLRLIHNIPENGIISILGVESEEEHDVPMSPNFIYPNPPISGGCLLSSAPLKNVTRVRIFKNDFTGECRGVLFEYNNGAQRAVGDCHLGASPDPFYDDSCPKWICLATTEHDLLETGDSFYSAMVAARSSPHEHSGGGVNWKCFPMKGVMEFWCSEKRQHVKIIDE
ncbi:hypothetical protein G7046_g7786 [Stylonectria norvegica]|nr:hypothetical protein G7046_g7786 [Stylonectria norvegica]